MVINMCDVLGVGCAIHFGAIFVFLSVFCLVHCILLAGCVVLFLLGFRVSCNKTKMST